MVLLGAGLAWWLERRKLEPGALRLRALADVPGLGLARGRSYRIDPEALIYLGDPVAVRGEDGDVLVTRYEDEWMGAVIGRVMAH